MCGVFGVINIENQPAFPYVYWGLRAQNHRGHQSHGFLTYDNGEFHIHRDLDLIPRIRANAIRRWLKRLPGNVGIGNVRYTTSGKTDERSLMKGMQPVIASENGHKLAVSFNGNVVNVIRLRKNIGRGSSFYGSDADVICYKLLTDLGKSGDLTLTVEKFMREVEGAFSVVGITEDGALFAFKDPYGIRPLCAGYSDDGATYALSSESVGLDINGFKKGFEVEPGELIIVSKDGFKRKKLVNEGRRAFCAFEFAYFARPDSQFNGKHVYEVREEFGRNLAKENRDVIEDADIIISMPETGDDAAFGVYEGSGLRWERASRRHRYVTERAFILLSKERYTTIDKKINILASKVCGKRVIITEDSIVRGDTTKITIKKLRRMHAERIYVFVTFPRIIGPCFYGIDMATYGELIGAKHDAEEIAKIIGADAVRYQSIEGFIRATGLTRNQLCLGCVTGEYPTPLAQEMADDARKRFLEGREGVGRLYEIADVVRDCNS